MAVRRMVSASAVARELGVADSTVRQYVREGRIPVALKTPGGHSRFILEDVRDAVGVMADQQQEETDMPFENEPIAPRTFVPVGVAEDGDVIVNLAGPSFEIAEDWQLVFGITAASIATGDDDGAVDPVVGVRGSGRFAVEHALVPA